MLNIILHINVELMLNIILHINVVLMLNVILHINVTILMFNVNNVKYNINIIKNNYIHIIIECLVILVPQTELVLHYWIQLATMSQFQSLLFKIISI